MVYYGMAYWIILTWFIVIIYSNRNRLNKADFKISLHFEVETELMVAWYFINVKNGMTVGNLEFGNSRLHFLSELIKYGVTVSAH